MFTISEAFQAFAVSTCAANIGQGKTKDKNLTQVELSEAILAVVATPEGKATPDMQAAIESVLESRDLTKTTGARSMATATLRGRIAQAKELVGQLEKLSHGNPAILAMVAEESAKIAKMEAELQAQLAPAPAATAPAPEGEGEPAEGEQEPAEGEEIEGEEVEVPA